MSKHQLQRSPIRFKGRADPSHIYLNSDITGPACPLRRRELLFTVFGLPGHEPLLATLFTAIRFDAASMETSK